MAIRVRLTQDVEFWRTGSRLGFADLDRAEAILGTDTFIIEDPVPILDDSASATAPVAETEQAPSEPEATFFDAAPQPEPAEQEPE